MVLVYNPYMIKGESQIEKIIPGLVLGLELFVLITDSKGKISYANDYFRKKCGNIADLSQLEHYFSFDICIIKEDEILTYTPLKAALSCEGNFLAAVSFEEQRYVFRSSVLRAFPLNGKKLFLISFDDFEAKDERFIEIQREVSKLRKVIEENKLLKQKAENQSVKTALLNRVSSIVRESFNLKEIVQKSLVETLKTLGAEGIAYFNEQNFLQPEFQVNFNEEISSLVLQDSVIQDFKLVVPVKYRTCVLGYLAVKLKRQWQKDEAELVESIASQLAIAINQVGLFDEVERQKKDLQNALEELKKAQTQLVQSEKMASLGQLVAGVAHEINTPLGAINSNNDMLIRCVEKLEEGNNAALGMIKNILPVSQDAIGRINTLVKSLKNFARLDEAAFQEADLQEGILSTLDLIRHEIKNRIEVVTDFGGLPRIKCKPNALNQVFMNILVNACQSIDDKGEITITTGVEGDKAFVKIKDTGRGIAKENLEKIFDPGFTTKGVGIGTGLGLSISYEIIAEHKGEISVESEVGKGTEFTIQLPISLD